MQSLSKITLSQYNLNFNKLNVYFFTFIAIFIFYTFNKMFKKLSKKINFFIFICANIIFVSCAGDVQIKKSALFYFQEGNTSLKQRDYQMAIWNYQKAINLDSDSPNFHYNLGLVYFEIGNYSESIESFKRVENLVPNQTDTYYNLALAYYKMSDSRKADIYYNHYQDMLSLRKAQERLEKVKKEQEQASKISESNSKPKIVKKSSSITKNSSNLKKRKLKIPNWEK